jgi:small subunit ribosomal protein S16
VAVRIRMKKMGRAHRAFFRVCAFDQNSPRDGRPLEELGTYDPSVPDSDARAVLNGERVAYWLSVGAQPSEKVAVLIKKYGKDGTHLSQQQQALSKLSAPKVVPDPGAPASKPKTKGEEAPAPATEEAAAPPAEEATAPAAEETAAPAAESATAEAAAEEKPAEEKPAANPAE